MIIRKARLGRFAQSLLLGISAFALHPVALALSPAAATPEGPVAEAMNVSGSDAAALQDAPVTVKVDAEDAATVNDLKDLADLVPGMLVTNGMNDTLVTTRLRGIGTAGYNAGLEPSVAVLIDGIPRPRAGAGFGDFIGLDRIDVYKGPQGAIFGRNSSAGAINVVTLGPVYETDIKADVTAGDFGALGAAASFSAGISDTVAFRLDLATRQRDGFIDVLTGAGPRAEDEDNDQSAYAFRGQLLFEPSKSIDINLSFDFSNRDENCCAAVTVVRGVSAATIDALAPDSGVAPVADPFARVAWSNRSTAQTVDDMGGDLRIAWTGDWLGGATLTSATSLRRWEAIAGADLDFSTADLFYREPTGDDDLTRTDTFTQEFRLDGSTDALDWQIGVSYLREDLDRNEAYRIGAAYEPFLSVETLRRINPALAASPTAPLFLSQASGRPFGTVFAGHSADDQYRQETTSLSLFTNNVWHVTDALDLTLGLRYSFDEKTLQSDYSNPNGGLGCSAMLLNPAQVVAALVARGLTVAQASAAAPQVVGTACLPWTNSRHNGRSTTQSIDSGEWAGTLKASFRFDEHILAYLSASRDYKPAGFNLDRVQSNNGLPSGTGGIVAVDDTSFEAETTEAYEFGVRTNWFDGALHVNAALFHHRVSDFQFNNFTGVSSVVRSIPEVTSTGFDADLVWKKDGLVLEGGFTFAETTYGDDALADPQLALLPGRQLSFAPRWTVTGGIGYEWDIGSNLTALVHVGAKFTSDYNAGTDLNPLKVQESYTLIDARIALAEGEGAWAIELWGQNLTDEDYLLTAFDAPLQDGSINAFLGAPRTLGLTLRVDY